WDLRGNMGEEIDRAILSAELPERRVEELYPEYPYDEHKPIVSGGAVVDGTFEPGATAPGTRNPRRPAYTAAQTATLAQLRDGLERLPALLGRGEGLGSNSWVVDGEHSSTGAPLLANDPHLGVGMPGVWMQMGLHCRRVSDACPLDVAGFTFSGTPGVIIGHNADIAWGFTNLGPDVTDLYLERVREEQWRYDGAWRDLDVRRETIEVRDGAVEESESSEGDDLGLRVLVGRRQAVVSTNDLSGDGSQALAERAVAMARAAPEDKYAGLADESLLAHQFPNLDLIDRDLPTVT
ncbi:MAG: penicillin acylase family protein, partial [Acidovorax sp.]|uniref:penicillin acylase family protein n=1 Tax=Acidovorax sp. TaxID=1872122 RepID=UPI00391BFDAE